MGESELSNILVASGKKYVFVMLNLGILKVNRDVFQLIRLFDSGKIVGYMTTRERV